jgi:hypothetical protein
MLPAAQQHHFNKPVFKKSVLRSSRDGGGSDPSLTEQLRTRSQYGGGAMQTTLARARHLNAQQDGSSSNVSYSSIRSGMTWFFFLQRLFPVNKETVVNHSRLWCAGPKPQDAGTNTFTLANANFNLLRYNLNCCA